MSPIKPENRALYGMDWPLIAREVKDDSYWTCQCDGRCGRTPHADPCGAVHGQPHPSTGSKVVLTVAHLDHDPSNNGEPHDRPNLCAMCQACHLSYDADHHAETRAATRDAAVAELGTLTLDGLDF